MGAVFVLAHAVAHFEHVHVVPVAGPGELAQAGLPVEDAQYAQASRETGAEFAVEAIIDIGRGAPRMANLAGPLPRLAHAPFAQAEQHRPAGLGDRVAHRGVGRFGAHAWGVAPVVLDVIDAPAGIGPRILIFVATATGTAAAGGRAGVRVDTQLESLAMHIVRQRLYPGWEALGVWLDIAVGVALALPAIVNVHVLVAGV